MMNECLTAFYDSHSRRMKVANIAGSEICQTFSHQGQTYKEVGYWGENDLIWSKDGKLIGFGLCIVDVFPCEGAKPVSCFRLPLNAQNAVVDGRRNDLNPDRDAFAEIVKSGISASCTYWWLTETWDEFENRLWVNEELWNGHVPDYYPTDCTSWPPGNLPFARVDDDGETIGDDFILPLESVGERLSSIDEIGFKLATEDIPK